MRNHVGSRYWLFIQGRITRSTASQSTVTFACCWLMLENHRASTRNPKIALIFDIADSHVWLTYLLRRRACFRYSRMTYRTRQRGHKICIANLSHTINGKHFYDTFSRVIYIILIIILTSKYYIIIKWSCIISKTYQSYKKYISYVTYYYFCYL